MPRVRAKGGGLRGYLSWEAVERVCLWLGDSGRVSRGEALKDIMKGSDGDVWLRLGFEGRDRVV